MAQQLKKKFIGNDQVDSTKILLEQNQAIRVKDSFGVEKDLIKLGSSDEVLVKGQQVSLKSSLDQEISDRQNADSAEQSARESAINSVESQLNSVETNLQSQIDALSGSSSSSLSALEAELNQEISDRIADVNAEESRAMGVEANLQSQIDNVLSNVDGAALDSLTEIVSAFQAADASLNGAITALSTGLSADIATESSSRQAADTALQGEIDAEEIARAAADTTLQNNINSEAATRLAADNALDARVDVLESVVWFKEKFTISNGQTFVTLSHSPENNSMSAFVDRLAIHQGSSEDYTISGTTMTFLNDLVSPGQSTLGNGDTIYVKYQYKV